MAQNSESFKNELKFGQEGEHEVASILLGKGISVLPLYQFENTIHAPCILTEFENIICPDLICFKNACFMVEVKTKRQWVEYNGVKETGFNEKHYNHYKKITQATGMKVYVFFNHKQNGLNGYKSEPLGIFYTELENYTRFWDGIVNGKKVHQATYFYNIDILKKIS